MIDKIIISANEDETYLPFWDPVSYAYRKMFPGVEIHLAFLTNRKEDDPFVIDLRKHGTVTLFPIHPKIPDFSQAKMIRFMLASEQGDKVVYIDDVDLYPLSKDFITFKTDKRPKGELLMVGEEVYNEGGQVPVSQMTAEGYIWKKFINPNNLSNFELMDYWINEPYLFHEFEDMMIGEQNRIGRHFSDEKLIKRLLWANPVPQFHMQRGYMSILENTLDRMAWDVNAEKLANHGYLNAHGKRPYKPEDYILLKQYIDANY